MDASAVNIMPGRDSDSREVIALIEEIYAEFDQRDMTDGAMPYSEYGYAMDL